MNTVKLLKLFLFIFPLFWISCSEKTEDNNGWDVCSECDVDSWIGFHSGTASHYNAATNKTVEGLTIEVEIEETATDYFTVYIEVPQQNYYATLSGDFVLPHAISFASSTRSVNATMLVQENQFRLSGISKRFQATNDSIIIKEVVDFDVSK